MSTDNREQDKDGPASLMGLFQPPSDKIPAAPSSGENEVAQESPQPTTASDALAGTDVSPSSALTDNGETDVTLGQDSEAAKPDLLLLFTPPTSTRIDETTPLIHDDSTRTLIANNKSSTDIEDLPFIREIPLNKPSASSLEVDDKHETKWRACARGCVIQLLQPTTYIGAFMFLLYHVVFSLSMGATVTRPHGGSPMLGIMSKMSASGVMFASFVYWWSLSDDVPALYPAVDLFCAPFLANLAVIVDDTLYNDDSVSPQDNDAVFLATFTFLTCLGLTITATLLMLASVFKLANLGAFLPSPVLSGFFAAVGVLLWTLAVKVDTNGMSVGQVIFSGDWGVVKYALVHHAPSLAAACAMKYLSPKSPFYVVAVIVSMSALVYLYMAVAHLGLEDMVQAGWFWSKSDLINNKMDPEKVGFTEWDPPAPAGWINSWAHGNVHWGAVHAGMSTAVALAFLYMIRCSLHGAALKKNISLMERLAPRDQVVADENVANPASLRESIRSLRPRLGSIPRPVAFGERGISEAVDIPNVSAGGEAAISERNETKWIVIKSDPTKHTLTEILAQYAYSQYICAFVGGFAMTPSIGPSSTLYSLGAESLAPQIGSVILLSVFFFTNFHLVVYIPKPAFSSVLCLAAIDIMDGWFVKSFQKTRSKVEWLVNPFIVVAAFSVGLLSAVFLGLALSTFFFVGSFYRSGVVKYAATCITMRSTIERPTNISQWLDFNGDQIQILVLQSFLFFGNATSVLNYVSSMFEAIDEEKDEIETISSFPPIPKVLLLDFSLVPGMDGSAVDVMSELLSVCSDHDCKVFFSGLSPIIRQTLFLGGVKPDRSKKDTTQRNLRYFPDLDSAVGKAEDTLIKLVYWPNHRYEQYASRYVANGTGFQRCLSQIDEQHQTSFAEQLAELGPYTRAVTLEPGQVLYEDKVFEDRGLFFVEKGELRIERSTDFTRNTLTRSGFSATFTPVDSIGHLRARQGTIARQIAQLKDSRDPGTQTFRLARIGPGWVIGDHEALSGLAPCGATIAVDRCRLHYISFDTLKELEQENPMLILQLYKLLSKLNALRSEVHIGQFAMLHNIMTAPSHNQPLTTRGSMARRNS